PAHPILIVDETSRALSVSTTMSRSMDWPRDSGPSIFPKYEALSLMSSVYWICVPYFFWNSRSDGCECFLLFVSMYSVQLEKRSVFASVLFPLDPAAFVP